MRRLLLAGAVLLCLATLAACDLRPGGQRLSKTSTGVPCNYVPSDEVSGSHAFASHMGALCIYYVRNDHVPTACESATSHDWCPSTNFDFYLYSEDDGQTYYCNQVDHYWCLVGTAHPVTDLAILCPWPDFAYDHLVDIGQTWVVIDHAQQHNATNEPSQFTFTAPMPSPNYPSWSGVRDSYTEEGFAAIVSSIRHSINPNVQSYVDTVGTIAQVTIPPDGPCTGSLGSISRRLRGICMPAFPARAISPTFRRSRPTSPSQRASVCGWTETT